MGLDMYLKASLYVSGWEHNTHPKYHALKALVGITPVEPCPSMTVSVTVGYWRKANAIHRWFVENAQDGNDDCESYSVSREQLEQLRAACQQVLDVVEVVDGVVSDGTTYYPDGRVEQHTHIGPVVAQADLAEKLLPTQSGFFFGETAYDEWYLENLRETVAIVDRVLADPALKECDFEYRASW